MQVMERGKIIMIFCRSYGSFYLVVSGYIRGIDRLHPRLAHCIANDILA